VPALSRLFLRHANDNDDMADDLAIALKDWLVRKSWSGPDFCFLDFDPEHHARVREMEVR
jgi:hypothetical protein